MKKLFLFAFVSTLFAQSVGTVTVSTVIQASTTTINAVAGVINCTFVHVIPDPTATFNVTCKNTNNAFLLKSDNTLPEGGAVIGSANYTNENITWSIKRKVGSVSFDYDIVANSVQKIGTF